MSLEVHTSRKKRKTSEGDRRRRWGIGKSSDGGGVSYDVDATQRIMQRR